MLKRHVLAGLYLQQVWQGMRDSAQLLRALLALTSHHIQPVAWK